MTREQIRSILERVMTWPLEDQERVARFVQQLEGNFPADDLTDEEWKIVEDRVARRELATDEEVKALFDRYRGA
jgi:hypothetical protein